MTILSVTMRTDSLSTSGTARPSVWAGAVLALAVSVPITAETKPAPPAQSGPTPVKNEAPASWTQGPNNMLILPWRNAASAGAGYFQQNLTSASFFLRVA